MPAVVGGVEPHQSSSFRVLSGWPACPGQMTFPARSMCAPASYAQSRYSSSSLASGDRWWSRYQSPIALPAVREPAHGEREQDPRVGGTRLDGLVGEHADAAERTSVVS